MYGAASFSWVCHLDNSTCMMFYKAFCFTVATAYVFLLYFLQICKKNFSDYYIESHFLCSEHYHYLSQYTQITSIKLYTALTLSDTVNVQISIYIPYITSTNLFSCFTAGLSIMSHHQTDMYITLQQDTFRDWAVCFGACFTAVCLL